MGGRAGRIVAMGTVALLCAAVLAGAGGPAGAATGPGHRLADHRDGICHSPARHDAMADRVARAIRQTVRHRREQTPVVAVQVADPVSGVECWLNARRHFDSASVVKAIILAALLRKAHTQHRWLSRRERSLAWRMITQSDNAAATALWDDVGMHRLHRLLDLARMGETKLSPAWGLTRITAHDETILLSHLLSPNPVLTTKARRYELWLMAHVIPSQRWGVPAGAPDSFTVHIKNGWAPLPSAGSPWWVNSIGCFTHHGDQYTIVVLTEGNATAAAGIRTIEDIAFGINRGLNPGTQAVIPYSTPSPSWLRPDEPAPA